MVVLARLDDRLQVGTVAERPNRFVLSVRFGQVIEPVHLADPGELAFLTEGTSVYCRPVDDPDRTTRFDAMLADIDGTMVSLRPTLANDLFCAAVDAGALPSFAEAQVVEREPAYPDGGRADARLTVDDERIPWFVEVKSCTHVVGGVGKFPDRPSARARRHLSSLIALARDGARASLVFVVQRPDVERVVPFAEVDPDFADLLGEADDAGVAVNAFSVRIEPPVYRLDTPALPWSIDS